MYVAFFFFQAEDGIRDLIVTGVQTCALPISLRTTYALGSTRIEPPHVDERQRAKHLPHRYREFLTYLRWRVRDLYQRDVHALGRLLRNLFLVPHRDEPFTPPFEMLHETAHPCSAAPFVFRRNEPKAGPAFPVECL